MYGGRRARANGEGTERDLLRVWLIAPELCQLEQITEDTELEQTENKSLNKPQSNCVKRDVDWCQAAVGACHGVRCLSKLLSRTSRRRMQATRATFASLPRARS